MNECPFRFMAWAMLSQERLDTGTYINAYCTELNCALWNESLGKCALAVGAYLKGLEVERKER